MLRTDYWRYPALQPLMPFIDSEAPEKVRKVKARWTAQGYTLQWLPAKKAKGWQDEAHQYVVYRFAKGEKIDLSNPARIAAITREPRYVLPYDHGKTKWVYVVTALDRMSNESEGKAKKVKL